MTDISKQSRELAFLKGEMRLRATERSMGDYFQRIVQYIPDDLIDKKFKFQLGDPVFLEGEADDPGTQHLKSSVELVGQRVEMLASAVNAIVKHHKSNMSRLVKLEEGFEKTMTLFEFREEHQAMEKKLIAHFDAKIETLNTQLHITDEKINENKRYFDNLKTNIKNECLWRIKDCEEMLKSRATTTTVEQTFKQLHSNIESKIKAACTATEK